jgi:hypothetical protein
VGVMDFHYVDNTAVLRRMRNRQRSASEGIIGQLPNSLGDYPAELPNRVLTTKGVEQLGPITAPTVAPPADDQLLAAILEIRNLLTRMPQSLSMEARTRFVVQPRESVSFITPSDVVSVPPGAAVAVCTQQIDQMFSGFLTEVGVSAAPGNLPLITWQIRINGAVHPKFGNNGNAIFSASTVATPLPFVFELIQNTQVSLVAINNGGAAIDVAGILIGWSEFLSTFKRYGTSPQSGIG